jgi:hypothetical protein
MDKKKLLLPLVMLLSLSFVLAFTLDWHPTYGTVEWPEDYSYAEYDEFGTTEALDFLELNGYDPDEIKSVDLDFDYSTGEYFHELQHRHGAAQFYVWHDLAIGSTIVTMDIVFNDDSTAKEVGVWDELNMRKRIAIRASRKKNETTQ